MDSAACGFLEGLAAPQRSRKSAALSLRLRGLLRHGPGCAKLSFARRSRLKPQTEVYGLHAGSAEAADRGPTGSEHLWDLEASGKGRGSEMLTLLRQRGFFSFEGFENDRGSRSGEVPWNLEVYISLRV